MDTLPIIHEHGYFTTDYAYDSFLDKGLCTELIKFFKEEKGTIVDLGCGDGRYVREFRENKIKADGYDGNPNTPTITNGLCKVLDLTEIVFLPKKYAWVLSLEVGEHLPLDSTIQFLCNIVDNCRKGAVISWAVRGQGGTGHINCLDNHEVQTYMRFFRMFRDSRIEKRLRDSVTDCDWLRNTIMVYRREK